MSFVWNLKLWLVSIFNPFDIRVVFHRSPPYNRLYDSRVGYKSRGRKSRKKAHKKFGLVTSPKHYIVHPGLFGSRSWSDWGVRVLFSMTRWETTRTSRKPQTNKPYEAMTSPSDKLTGLEKCTASPRPDLQSVLPFQFWWISGKKRGSSVDQSTNRKLGQCWIFGSHHLTKTTNMDICVILIMVFRFGLQYYIRNKSIYSRSS